MPLERSGLPPVEFVRQTQARFRRAGAGRALLMADAYERAWAATLTGPRHGRRYRWRGRIYTASAPGEAPALRSGALREDIHVQIDQSEAGGGWRFAVRVRSALPYATYLEQGTRRMARRPILEPVLKRALPELRRISRLRLGA